MTLYEIDWRINFIFENCTDPETGEIDESCFEELERLGMERDQKIENTALFAKNIRSDIDQINAEIKALQDRKRHAEGTLKRVEGYLQRSLNGNKFETPRVGISFRKSQSVNVTDLWQIPEEYLRYKDPEADKVKIKAALKDGQKVPGAELVDNQSMTIK